MRIYWYITAIAVSLIILSPISEGIRLVLVPLTADQVYQTLKEVGREDVIPKGRIITHGIATVNALDLDAASVAADTTSGVNATNITTNLTGIGKPRKLCFSSRISNMNNKNNIDNDGGIDETNDDNSDDADGDNILPDSQSYDYDYDSENDDDDDDDDKHDGGNNNYRTNRYMEESRQNGGSSPTSPTTPATSSPTTTPTSGTVSPTTTLSTSTSPAATPSTAVSPTATSSPITSPTSPTLTISPTLPSPSPSSTINCLVIPKPHFFG